MNKPELMASMYVCDLPTGKTGRVELRTHGKRQYRRDRAGQYRVVDRTGHVVAFATDAELLPLGFGVPEDWR